MTAYRARPHPSLAGRERFCCSRRIPDVVTESATGKIFDAGKSDGPLPPQD